MDCFIQFLLTDSIPLTFLFEPALDFLQLKREVFFHRLARWFALEGTALVETFSRCTKQIPKVVASVFLFNDGDLAKSKHIIMGKAVHSAKVCLVGL